MNNMINVRDILGVEEKRPPLFFRPVGPDKHEAAKRLAVTEKFFEDWHGRINETNTRQLPADLVDLYEDATITLCRVLQMEKQIVSGGA